MIFYSLKMMQNEYLVGGEGGGGRKVEGVGDKKQRE